MIRLSDQALVDYRGPAVIPTYDRARIAPGILHLGIGAFHRAHQAVYVDRFLATCPSWGIIGVSLRRPATATALKPQNGLYTLAVKGSGGTDTRIVGSVLDVLHFGEDPDRVISLIADPAIRIVSLTVTEKGYCLRDGGLDTDDPEVAADLTGRPPQTMPGVLATGLVRRAAAGAGPVTVLSCDNLSGNGVAALRAVCGFVEATGRGTGWIEDNVRFPSTMVDRITPATTPGDHEEIAALTGLRDAWPVVTEPFVQWVIEDDFAAGRPAFAAAGARMTADVEPYEAMKVRLLNGAHSTMAYLGPFLGHTTVAGAVADDALATLLTRVAREEVMPGLNVPGVDLSEYWASLMERFANPAMEHRLEQIAMDGSQKLPQRIVPPLAENRARGAPSPGLTLALAAWIAHVVRAEGFHDPLANELDGRIRAAGENLHDLVAAMLAEIPGFGLLSCDDGLVRDVEISAAALLDGRVRHLLQAAELPTASY